jgi:hypothetical protein
MYNYDIIEQSAPMKRRCAEATMAILRNGMINKLEKK